jgi:flagellar biosynthesis chaperone FliJ
MPLHPLDSRITSCCAEIIEALCTQNRDLKRELEEAYNQFELIKYQLKEARTERDELCELLNYCRLNGFDLNEGGHQLE